MAGLIKKVNLRDQVYVYLKDAIFKQDFKRGQNINLDELSRNLGVSNTPIRESINSLVKEGLIEYRQNNGFYVIDPDKQTVNDLMQLVFFIVVAAYRFCYRNSKVEEIIPRLEEELAKERKCLDDNNPLGFIEITSGFERCIVETVGNRILLSEYDSKMALMSFAATYYHANDLQRLKRVWSEHNEIFECIKQGKLEETVLQMRQHYYNPEGKTL